MHVSYMDAFVSVAHNPSDIKKYFVKPLGYRSCGYGSRPVLVEGYSMAGEMSREEKVRSEE